MDLKKQPRAAFLVRSEELGVRSEGGGSAANIKQGDAYAVPCSSSVRITLSSYAPTPKYFSSYLRMMMTKLCIKIHMKSDSAI